MSPLSVDDEAKLREALKRCSPATLEAARKFRQTGAVEHLHALVLGVIERYVERERRPKLHPASAQLRLAEDLGLDSLTLMEIVLLIEDVLPVTIDNEHLRDLRTIGDLRQRLAELSIPAAAVRPPAGAPGAFPATSGPPAPGRPIGC
jgi:acyl carrier protein